MICDDDDDDDGGDDDDDCENNFFYYVNERTVKICSSRNAVCKSCVRNSVK